MPLTVLAPSAGRSSRFGGMRPKWMLIAPDGRLMLDMALDTVRPLNPDRIIVGILREHEDRYQAREGIRRALGGEVEVVVLDKPTGGPAETVDHMISQAGVTGPIAIKDNDSWFRLPTPWEGGNVVAGADLRDHPGVTEVGAKSFVVANQHGLVERIVEKSVVSNIIGVGAYFFEQAEQFQAAFRRVRDLGGAEIFVSHVITQAIFDGALFRAALVADYVDVGTAAAWMAFRKNRRSFFLDLDGVVFRNHGEFFPPYWGDPEEPIEANIAALRALQAEGAQFVFVTARPERMRAVVEAALREQGLTWHALVMGCHHAQRVIVNDYAPSNPYPASLALNLERNGANLGDLLG